MLRRIVKWGILSGLMMSMANVTAMAASIVVGATAIVEHPALKTIYKGFVDELARQGYQQGKNLQLKYQTAQNSPVTALQIANQYAGDQVKLIFAIATPSAQTAMVATHQIPIVFAGVTDPISARLAPSWAATGTNITGVSEQPPVEKMFAVIHQILPHAKNIGFIYNTGESNSVYTLSLLKQHAAQYGYHIIEASAARTVDVQAAARALVGRIDALYVSTDNTVVAALDGIILVTNRNKIPVFSEDLNTVNKGALVAMGADYYRSGIAAGKIAAQILSGHKKAGEIPIERFMDPRISLNKKAAQLLGIEFPSPLIEKAASTI